MVENKNGYNPENERKEYNHIGFYYDAQMENPSLVMSLHPSTYETEKGVWEKYKQKDSLETCMGGNDVYYSKTPIAQCLLTDDISFGINNNFSDFNGGNPIEQMWGSMKSWAPTLTALSENLKGTNLGSQSGGTLSSWAAKIGDTISQLSGKAGENLNKALIVQGSRFSYYNGSNFGFNNLDMKFTKFSDYVKDKSGNWSFMDVRDYINNVLGPYSYGTYHPIEVGDTAKGYVEKAFGQEIANGVAETVSKYVGMQTPPGGFKMETQNLDHALQGTLRLNIGGMYAIENLIIKNVSVNLSKVQAKHPYNPGETIPLYADITISLAPAGMVTDSSFAKIMNNGGMKKIQEIQTKNYRAALEEIKKKRRGES